MFFLLGETVLWTFAHFRKIPLRVHGSMLILLPFIAVGVGGDHLYELITTVGRNPDELFFAPLVLGIFVAMGIFVSILAHELGHALAAQKLGAEVSNITVMLLGGVTKIKHRDIRTPQAALRIALAGPLANVLVAGLCFVLTHLSNGQLDTLITLSILGTANLFIAGFNLLPAFPLDGGRVLEAILWQRIGREKAIRIASSIGRFFATFMGILGLLNGQFLMVVMAAFFYFGAMAQRLQLKTSPQSTLEFVENRPLQSALQVDETQSPKNVAGQLRHRGGWLALVYSVRGTILGIVDLEELEQTTHDALSKLSLANTWSVYVGDESTMPPERFEGWILMFDEYNVLLGVSPSQ